MPTTHRLPRRFWIRVADLLEGLALRINLALDYQGAARRDGEEPFLAKLIG